jgi:hypothetical protein
MLIDNQAPALITGTPKGMNRFHELYSRGMNGDPKYEAFTWTSYDNPWLPEDAMAEFKGLPESLYRQEVLAEFIDDLGGVFRGVSEIIAGDLQDPVAGRQYVFGVDLAKTQDFTVVIGIDKQDRHLVYFDRFKELDWNFQEENVAAAARRYNNAVVLIDATGLGDPPYDHLNKAGVRVKGYKFTNESKRKLIENLSIAIQHGALTTPDIPELINELRIFQADQTPMGNIRYNAPEGYHDDCVIALALAVWELGRYTEFTAAPSMGGTREWGTNGKRKW